MGGRRFRNAIVPYPSHQNNDNDHKDPIEGCGTSNEIRPRN